MTNPAEGGRQSRPESATMHDSEAALQEELRREAAEHADLGGDTATNRNLTGSTTWVTLGADARSDEQSRGTSSTADSRKEPPSR